MIYKMIGGLALLFFLMGCGGEVKQLKMRDTGLSLTEPNQGLKTVEFPKGTWTGGASKEQAGSLAQLFVDSHNMAMGEFSKLRDSQESIKTAQEALKNSSQRLEETNRRILEAAQKHQETAQQTLQKIEELSKKQGTGEITLFYSAGTEYPKGEFPGIRPPGPICRFSLQGKQGQEHSIHQLRQRLGLRTPKGQYETGQGTGGVS